VIAIVYAVVARASFLVTIPPGNISPIFPAAGIALAAVLIMGRSALIGVWLGSFLANMFFFVITTIPSVHSTLQTFLIASFIGIGAISGAGASAFLVNYICKGEHPLYSGWNVLMLAVVGGLGGCMISPTIGVLSLSFGGYVPWERFGYSWLTWWVGDAIGAIITAPFFLAWHQPYPFHHTSRHFLEAAVLGIVTILLCLFVFFQNIHIEYGFMPLLLWAAFRFGMRGVTTTAVAIAIFTIISASRGNGPFVGETVNESLLLLHSFLGVTTICALFVAGVLAERNRAKVEVTNARDDLELFFDIVPDMVCIASTDGYFKKINNRWQEVLGFTAEELLNKPFIDFVHPEDIESTRREVTSLEKGKITVYFTNRYRCKDGSYKWLEWMTAPAKKTFLYAAARDITERKLVEIKLKQITRLYALRGQISHCIVRIQEPNELFNAICRVAIESGQFRMAWVGLTDQTDNRVRPVAQAGHIEGYLDNIFITVDELPAGKGPTGSAIREAQIKTSYDIATEPQMQQWRVEALKRGYRSSAAVPFRCKSKTIGALTLYASETSFFTTDEQKLLKEISDEISFALDAMELRVEQKKVNKALLESEINLKKAQEIAKVGSWRHPLTTELSRSNEIWSDELYKIYGVSPESFNPNNNSFVNRIHPDDRPAMLEWIRACEMGEKPGELEFRVIYPDNTVHWISGRGELIYNADNTPAFLSGTAQDITERKQTEEKLKETNILLRIAGAKAKLGGWSINLKENRVIWSDEVAAIHEMPAGYSPLLEDAFGFYPPEWREKIRKHFNDCSQNGIPYDEDLEIITANKKRVWVRTIGEAVRNNEGKIIKVQGAFQDITERKQEEATRQKFVMLADSSSEFIGMCDFDLKPIYVNPAGVRMVGLPDMAAACRVKVQDYFFPEDQRFIAEEFFPRVMREGSGDVEIRLRNFKTGEPIWTFYNLFCVRDASGKTVGWATVSRDITERKKAEEALQVSEQKYSSLFNSMLEGFALHEIICDTNGKPVDYRFLDLNPAFERLTGLKKTTTIGKTVLEIMPATELFWIEKYGQVALTGEPITFENYSSELKRSYQVMAFSPQENQFAVIFNDISDVVNTRTLLQASIESPKDILIMAADRDYRYLCFNSAHKIVMKNVYGKDIEIGMNALDCITSAPDLQNAKTNYDRALAGESHSNIQEYGVSQKVYFESFFNPILDNHNKIIGITAFARDITGRKLMEEDLAKNRILLKAIIEGSTDAIYVKDIRSRYLLFNRAAEQFTGKKFQDAFGKDDTFLFAAEEAAIIMNADSKVMAEGKIVTYEEFVTSSTGEKLVFFSTKGPVFDSTGKVSGLFGIARDITERKRAEEALRSQTERLQNLHLTDQSILLAKESPEDIALSILKHIRSLIHCQRASIGIFDSKMKEVRVFAADVNGQSIIQTGKILAEEAYGDLDILRQNKMEIVEDMLKVHSPSAVARIFQMEGIRSYINVPLVSAQGLIGALNVSWEVPRLITQEEKEIAGEVAGQIAIAIEQARLRSETKHYAAELEERVRERTDQLQAANKELESFSYSVSHDLRAPLRAVDGYTHILLEDYSSILDAEGKRVCTIISDSARDMGKLIDDLLTFSRIGRAEMQTSVIDMATMVQSIFLEVTTSQSRERIDFNLSPLPSISGDPNLIRQVWINFLSNAVKFSSKMERAVIKINAQRRDNDIIYSVSDNGAGFDMQYASKLFGVFQRLHSTKEFEGTGVGLAIVQRIIMRHGGKVWAEGEIGNGAVFYFSLPFDDKKNSG
jgi:PAS domain S-box-containing protein